jgi:recombination protein RecA
MAKSNINKHFLEISKAVKADEFLKNQVMVYGEGAIEKTPKIPIEVPSIDIMLDGGIAVGRIIELLGPESGGKTTLALHAIASCQANGGVCCFIDVENGFDKWYATQLGVKVEELLVAQPDNGEAAFEICQKMLEYNVDLIVLDSVASLCPKDELEKDLTDSEKMGLLAKLMNRGLRQIVGSYNLLKNKKTTMIFINQIREKIGVMYGSPETTPGGRALKHYASVRIDIRRLSEEKKVGDQLIAKKSKLKVLKSKVSRPFLTCEVWLDCSANPVGFRKDLDLIETAITEEVVFSRKWNVKEKKWQNARSFYFIRNTGEYVYVGKNLEETQQKLIKNKQFYNEVLEALKCEEQCKPTQESLEKPIEFSTIYGKVELDIKEGQEEEILEEEVTESKGVATLDQVVEK